MADIAAFREAQCEVRCHFEGEGALVHFGSEPRDSPLDSQDFVGVPPDRRRAGPQERLPNFREAPIFGPHLKSRRPVRSAPNDPALSTVAQWDRGEGVEGEPADFRSHHLSEDVGGIRPFDGDVARRTELAELHVVAHPPLLQNLANARGLRGVHVQDQRVSKGVQADVGEDAALLVEQQRISGRPRSQDLHVDGHESVEERDALGTGQLELRTVAQIDHAGPASDRGDFLVQGTISGGNVPVGFRTEQGPGELMVGTKRELAHRRSDGCVGAIRLFAGGQAVDVARRTSTAEPS